MGTDGTYIVTDVETTGLCPGVHAMIALASVAVNAASLTRVSAFQQNLRPLPGSGELATTMKFWEKHPDAYARATADPHPAAFVMRSYDAWLQGLPKPLVFVGYPVVFDYTFVWYYQWRLVSGSPFAHGGLDLKTLAMALRNTSYDDARKAAWPSAWLPPVIRTHVALEDAEEQAYSLVQMLLALRQAQHPLASLPGTMQAVQFDPDLTSVLVNPYQEPEEDKPRAINDLFD